jgi:hypothetical protein
MIPASPLFILLLAATGTALPSPGGTNVPATTTAKPTATADKTASIARTFKALVYAGAGLRKFDNMVKSSIPAPQGVAASLDAHSEELVDSSGMQDLEDPCVALSTDPTYSSAVACLNYFPFEKDLKDHTIGVIKKALQLSVFQDLAAHPPEPNLIGPYDVAKAIDAIDQKNDWLNDRDWQEALMDVFLPLRDAHSQYTAYCYTRIVFKQPFLPVAKMDTQDKTRVYVGGVAGVAGDDDFQYLGREIIEIDGRPALDVLTEFADTRIGLYKDPSTRFNDVFATRTWTNDGTWQVVPGKFASRIRVPKKKSIKYTFAPKEVSGKPETVVAAWMVNLPVQKPFTNAFEYLSNFCFAEDIKASRIRRMANEALERKQKQLQAKRIDVLRNPVLNPHLRPDILAKLDENGQVPQPAAGSEGMALYYTNNGKVAVLVVPTFKYNNDLSKGNWRMNMASLLEDIKTKGVTKVILDLSGNGGGNVCLAAELNQALIATQLNSATFPASKDHLPKDQRMSDLMKLLVQTSMDKNIETGPFHPAMRFNLKTNEPFKGQELVVPGREHPQLTQFYKDNQQLPKYSELFDHICTPGIFNPLAEVALGIAPGDISIMTAGNCGSACALLLHSLHEFSQAKTFAVGYRLDQQRMAAAFPGGQAYQLEDLQDVLEELELDPYDYPLLPDWFKVSAFLSMPIREAYSTIKPNVPLEYAYIPAEHMINVNYTYSLRPDLMWEHVVAINKW